MTRSSHNFQCAGTQQAGQPRPVETVRRFGGFVETLAERRERQAVSTRAAPGRHPRGQGPRSIIGCFLNLGCHAVFHALTMTPPTAPSKVQNPSDFVAIAGGDR